MEHYGLLSILPSILALGFAIWSKRVIPSLLLGILTGTFIMDTNENGLFHAIIYSIVNLFKAVAGHPGTEELRGVGIASSPGRAEIIIVILLLGAFIGILNRSGGAYAFGTWLSSKVKSKNGAQVATAVMGSSLFTSAYFSSLATGTVFRPIFDRMKISREKLAFYLDSTSAPINVLIPISGWVAFMGALMVDNIPGVDDPIAALASTIPYNFYNLVMLAMVFLFATGKIKDFGPMKQAELKAQSDGYQEGYKVADEASTASEGTVRNGTTSDMVLPLSISVAILVVLGLWNYTVALMFDVSTVPLNGNQMLIVSFSVGILIAFIKYISSKLMTAKEFLNELFEGSKSVILGAIIIILAVTLGDLMRAAAPEGLGASAYLEQVAGGVIPSAIIPFSVFIISAFVSFSMGTSWGTWAIMMPIGVSLTLATGGDPILAAAAVLSGGTFGDHTSPISDTSVMSSVGADCEHMNHINTQLPYALVAASIAAVFFLVIGFVI
ncbi:hypothetical protein NC797_02610 [Aquibacillus sp. 3ASR75-11]|uniref:Na+/H+ antiporter NhaC-like C-terminal domain-containing protein n=1 Tax=Terrihalobacillus insolitus TaxID=2950438 RepID=A0A9X4AMD5_9BACI|nr:Na+/H+ antiporter NhaC family protein [Terrihalobacillus insolitus]MDC3411915.1 hypothetical protein [Terrihalobacillus insolitus]MDC3423398.1 hypothetical protein [Terrihalobacillus insolitus]